VTLQQFLTRKKLKFRILNPSLNKTERENAAPTILRNSTLLLILVDDILNFSRSKAGCYPLNIDLVLMDIHMPIIDGFATVENLRQKGFTKAIVVFTASATWRTVVAAVLMSGCDALLTKPFSRESLIRVLEEYLDWPRSETLESRIETIRTEPSYLMLVDRFQDALPAKIGA